MPELSTIKKQIENLDGSSKFLARKEIKELPGILWEDEAVEGLVHGFYNSGQGLLVATNKRLIFVDKGVFKLRVEDFPFDKISSIQYETGMLQGKITIFASGNRADITNVEKQQARTFAEYVRARISKKNDPSPIKGTDDTISQLEQLASLKERGIITEEEFKNQKLKILS